MSVLSPVRDPAGTAHTFPLEASPERETATVDLLRRMKDPMCPSGRRARLRDEAVRLNLAFARRCARMYRCRGESVDDLEQVAALALLKAVDGYDPDRGSSFTGYAVPTILGELKRHFRDRAWSLHVPRAQQERCLEVTRARSELAQRLQRTPSPGDIAGALGITEAEVRATEAAASAYRADSLNRPLRPDDDAGERLDRLGADDRALDGVVDRVAVDAYLDRLDRRARLVLDRYFCGNRTQTQIADEL